MKKILVLSITLLLTISLVGCGKSNDIKHIESEDINENTKVSTIAESYTKYVELKSNSFEQLQDNIPDSDYSLALSLLAFSAIDLTMVPITMCGLNETEAARFYSLYTNLDYKSEKDKCTISFTNEGKTDKYVSIYDNKTDSVQTKFYENDVLKITSEYVKLNEGYATSQYIIDESNNTAYRSIFKDNYITVGVFENVTTEPASIYKTKSIASEEWTKGGTYWSKYDNGKIESLPKE